MVRSHSDILGISCPNSPKVLGAGQTAYWTGCSKMTQIMTYSRAFDKLMLPIVVAAGTLEAYFGCRITSSIVPFQTDTLT